MSHIYIKHYWVHYPNLLWVFLQGLTSMTTNLNQHHQQSHNFKLWSLGDRLNHVQVTVLQSTPTCRWSPANRSMVSINFTTKAEALGVTNSRQLWIWKTPRSLIYSEHAKVAVVNFGADHFRRKGLRTSKITRRPKS
jgi:hypothetical protein